MKATMVIPSYWRGPSEDGIRGTDAVFDHHPTVLDEAGTLGRAIESIATLQDRDFDGEDLFCHLIGTQDLWKEIMAFTAQDDIRGKLADLR